MILISILIFAGLAYFFAVFLQNKKVANFIIKLATLRKNK